MLQRSNVSTGVQAASKNLINCSFVKTNAVHQEVLGNHRNVQKSQAVSSDINEMLATFIEQERKEGE